MPTTETRQGPAVKAIEKNLADAGINTRSIIAQRDVRTTDSSEKENLPFAEMAMKAPRLTPEQAKKLLAIPHWRGALTVTIAFAYQRNRMPRYGAEGYKSTFDSKDPSRKVLGLPSAATILQVSPRSLCHSTSSHQVPGLSSLALPVSLTLSQ